MLMEERIDYFFNYLTTITRDEADFIYEILTWDAETKYAFIMAKQLFEATIDKTRK